MSTSIATIDIWYISLCAHMSLEYRVVFIRECFTPQYQTFRYKIEFIRIPVWKIEKNREICTVYEYQI